jgi:hypothetical protein
MGRGVSQPLSLVTVPAPNIEAASGSLVSHSINNATNSTGCGAGPIKCGTKLQGKLAAAAGTPSSLPPSNGCDCINIYAWLSRD